MWGKETKHIVHCWEGGHWQSMSVSSWLCLDFRWEHDCWKQTVLFHQQTVNLIKLHNSIFKHLFLFALVYVSYSAFKRSGTYCDRSYLYFSSTRATIKKKKQKKDMSIAELFVIFRLVWVLSLQWSGCSFSGKTWKRGLLMGKEVDKLMYGRNWQL